MNKVFGNCIAFSISLCGPAAMAGEPTPADIDAVFAAYDSEEAPGCALGIYRGGEIAYARGYGMANLEYDIPLTPDSVFRMASTSKQFVATAIALLHESGDLDLDDPVQKYFPQMPDYGSPVTLRQLVHHTSGIRDYLDLAELADMGDSYSTESALRLVTGQQALNFEPGSQHLYSNSGYLLLAQVVEKVTGQSLREWTHENMFEPLGMEQTHFHDDHTHVVPRRADGYAPGEDEKWRISMTQLDMVGDGGLYSTIGDLKRWDDNFSENRLGKKRQELIHELEKPGRLENGEELDYAFGLFVDEFHGAREVAHGGTFVGFRTEIARYPGADLGLAVLCNRADADPRSLARQVAALYLAEKQATGSRAPSPVQADGKSPAAVKRFKDTDEKLQQYAGHYWHEDKMMVQGSITEEDGDYYLVFSGWGRFQLDPGSASSFRASIFGSPAQVSFTGAAMKVAIQGWTEMEFERYAPDSFDTGEIKALAGNYYSPELDHFQRLEQTGDQLVARRRTGDEELLPVPGDRFISGRAVIEFERDARGRVVGFSASTERVKNLKYKRL
ncbi:serine hydrolase domain-containing protein [Microbulbifer zhoushanensis]|uniref:serine hydrolase domain-containing protein n=1 Tax=Microbulbifer zhoushanensis TaxID=2904254 RepID=UPI001F47919F|nr:serine hydrolase domain-containing protein [Microbulbifer zhoushanensis]